MEREYVVMNEILEFARALEVEKVNGEKLNLPSMTPQHCLSESQQTLRREELDCLKAKKG